MSYFERETPLSLEVHFGEKWQVEWFRAKNKHISDISVEESLVPFT